MDRCKYNSPKYIRLRNSLLESTMLLIYKMAEMFADKSRHLDRQDIIQQATLETLLLLDGWKPQRAKLHTYLWQRLYNKMCDYVRETKYQVRISKSAMRKHKGSIKEISFSGDWCEYVDTGDSTSILNLDTLFYIEEKNSILKNILLTEKQIEALATMASGKKIESPRERKRLSNHCSTVKRKVKEYKKQKESEL